MLRLLPLLLLSALSTATHLTSVTSLTCEASSCDVAFTTSDLTSDSPISGKIAFHTNDIVQYWVTTNTSDVGCGEKVLAGLPDLTPPLSISLLEQDDRYEISSDTVTVTMMKDAVFSINGYVKEAAPLSWNGTTTTQTLAPSASASAVLGGGMQNGRFVHTDSAIGIGVDYNWEDEGHPNSVPWYMNVDVATSATVGVLRNTWAPGMYSFSSTSPSTLAHNETARFDAFYMVGSSPQDVLASYTAVTGPPFLPPIYGFGVGDSDCYHNDRHGNSTSAVLAVAEKYRALDMPGGWFLPNDGYGCGYGEPTDGDFPTNLTSLTSVVAGLHDLGFYSGLWTSTGMPNIVDEVGTAGTRICKTDVGWIGDGYEYAFDGVQLCADGIEDNSDARRFVWTVEGWAGTHRLAVMWTGDDTSDFEYIRWQIPTYVGCGFSAQAHVSGDIDGIFGGSPKTYVRDLQFKALTTTIMSMSGWAENPDKQPWTWGEPYTSINRMYLKLKSRLTPYMYSLSRTAHDTGVPPLRAMLLEFPDDPSLYSNSTGTAQQFMAGPSLLVAPVYRDEEERDGIYFPTASDGGEAWLDWWDGSLVASKSDKGTIVDGYPAPLDTLPLFVRAGTILPLWPENNFFDEKPHDPISLELWPQGESDFTLYEDDGVTRKALEASPPAFARTPITMCAPADFLMGEGRKSEAGDVKITVAAFEGAGFDGQLASRAWELNVRAAAKPQGIEVDSEVLVEHASEASFDAAAEGWFFDASVQGGLVMVKVGQKKAAEGFTVELKQL